MCGLLARKHTSTGSHKRRLLFTPLSPRGDFQPHNHAHARTKSDLPDGGTTDPHSSYGSNLPTTATPSPSVSPVAATDTPWSSGGIAPTIGTPAPSVSTVAAATDALSSSGGYSPPTDSPSSSGGTVAATDTPSSLGGSVPAIEPTK